MIALQVQSQRKACSKKLTTHPNQHINKLSEIR